MRGLVNILFFLSGGSTLKFEDHGYTDLLVTVSPDINPDQAAVIIENIKSFIEAGSDTLYSSSRGWAYLRSVRILIPTDWTDVDATTVDGIVYEDGDIRINTKSGVYGNSPFTVQTGGCGDPGEYIQLSGELFSRQTYDKLNETYGPHGQVFVHEWAKYRYGVFEEHGFPGDEKYPMFYYRVKWTSEGQENKLYPNFCTNIDSISYTMENWLTGGECSFDSNTGLPEADCFPVIAGNNTIASSIMAIPYLKGNNQFCDDDESYLHRWETPTKHNDICNGKSTFRVVLDHPDFTGYFTGNQEASRKTSFEIIRPASSSSFVMVLDVSGSMDDNCDDQPEDCELRIERLKQSVMRWIEYDVPDGVPLGLVEFESNPHILSELRVTDPEVKQVLINTVKKLSAYGGTCLGDALLEGIKVLNRGGVTQGGVIIFLTDGKQSCTDGPNINDVIQDVVMQGVRVITIAFSEDADPNIITLSEASSGKSYFVPDNSGPEVINAAMQGALTYQPSVPSNQVDTIIFEQSFKNQSIISFNFTVDKFVGQNITLEIDFSGNNGSTIRFPDNTMIQLNHSTGVFRHLFKELDVGIYSFELNTLSEESRFKHVSIKVTGLANGLTLPIMTKCWTNIGNSKADLALPDSKVFVIAEVKQGTNPVIGAQVIATIERDDQLEPLKIILQDAGTEPDNVANDGLYARYVTGFEKTSKDMRYSLKCYVEGTDESKINQGQPVSRATVPKSLPNKPQPGFPLCCGSSTLTENSVLYPTGHFTRSYSGGLLEVVNADNMVYPAGRVTNLRAEDVQNPGSFSLSFTAPGLQLDSGTCLGWKVYHSMNLTSLVNEMNILGSVPFLRVADVLNPASLVSQVAGTQIKVNVKREHFQPEMQYYFRLASVGENKISWSNIARVFLKTPVSSGTSFRVGFNILTMLVVFKILISPV